jgi:Domain of unknown function (DUF4351)
MADHDQRFKTLLREFFAEFVQLFFPAWADRFDFSGVEWLDQEAFPDPPQGRRRVPDLVARLPVRLPPTLEDLNQQQPWIVLLHVEVEARDSVAPLRGRMFAYYHYLRYKHQIPVLPVGLYLQVGLDGVGWDVHEEWFWEQRVVHFEYAYIGLPALDAFEYLNGKNTLGVALSALMRVSEERRVELKAQAIERLATSRENEWRRYLLCECVEAYLPLEGRQLAEYEQLLQTECYKEAYTMAVTSFEKGVEKGQRLLLQRQLERRFGRLSPPALERLAAWPGDRLEDLAEAFVTAASLKDLGLED